MSKTLLEKYDERLEKERKQVAKNAVEKGALVHSLVEAESHLADLTKQEREISAPYDEEIEKLKDGRDAALKAVWDDLANAEDEMNNIKKSLRKSDNQASILKKMEWFRQIIELQEQGWIITIVDEIGCYVSLGKWSHNNYNTKGWIITDIQARMEGIYVRTSNSKSYRKVHDYMFFSGKSPITMQNGVMVANTASPQSERVFGYNEGVRCKEHVGVIPEHLVPKEYCPVCGGVLLRVCSGNKDHTLRTDDCRCPVKRNFIRDMEELRAKVPEVPA